MSRLGRVFPTASLLAANFLKAFKKVNINILFLVKTFYSLFLNLFLESFSFLQFISPDFFDSFGIYLRVLSFSSPDNFGQ